MSRHFDDAGSSMTLRGWLADAVRRLPPGAFAFVMATGIVSSAFDAVGQGAISAVLLGVALIGLVLLTIAILWRVVAYRVEVLRDAGEPGRAFGFFTVVAAVNVVGVRLYTPEAPVATIVLAVLSVPLWLLLTYGVPGTLILRDRDSPVSAEVNGSWFLWVVGTQSLATAAAALGEHANNAALADAAVALWGIGVMLYVMLATLVTLRLLTTRRDPHRLGPSYWIYMGATAITVLAGSRDPRAVPRPARTPHHGGLRFRVHLRFVGVRHVVDTVACRVRHLATRGASRTRAVRIGALEHRLPARNVLGREHALRRNSRTCRCWSASARSAPGSPGSPGSS